MTKRTAKKLSLEIWGYFKDHPECDTKNKLPKNLWRQISCLECNCPLCEYFFNTKRTGCNKCPLHIKDALDYSCVYWKTWRDAYTISFRKDCAQIIYDKIIAWDI